MSEGTVIAGVRPEGPEDDERIELQALDAKTGEVLARSQHGFRPTTILSDGDLIGMKDDGRGRTQTRTLLRATWGEKLETRWTSRSSDLSDREGNSRGFTDDLAVAEGLIFVGRDGCLLAMDACTGEVVWATSLTPYGGARNREAWRTVADRDRVYINVTGGVIAVAATDGQVLWQLRTAGVWTVRRDGLHLVTPVGGYVHVDSDTGRVIFEEAHLGRSGGEESTPAGDYNGIAVSQSHVFILTSLGRVAGLKRPSLEPVWEQTHGAGMFFPGPIMFAEQQLLMTGVGLRPGTVSTLYCYEEG